MCALSNRIRRLVQWGGDRDSQARETTEEGSEL